MIDPSTKQIRQTDPSSKEEKGKEKSNVLSIRHRIRISLHCTAQCTTWNTKCTDSLIGG
jgi:hypothetical protein